jgi:CheY-like chemotaxis protein
MGRRAGESGSPSRRPASAPIVFALALPFLLSVGWLFSARRNIAAAAAAGFGLLLLAWTRGALRRMVGEGRRAVGALADTEAALIETRARLAEAEQRAALADLAGSLAHDFNNQLTGIQGYARLLLDRVGPGDPIRRQLAAIVNAAARAADLASQIQALDPRAGGPSTLPADSMVSARRAVPGAAGPAAATRPATTPAPPAQRHTILAVDDEPTILALAKDVLELEGYRVLVARNGEEAVRAYRDAAGGIDLVLLDLTMPVMGGIECFRRLRAIDPAVRVVISSGFTSENTAVEMLREGALDCLQKPYEIQALARTVAAALSRAPVAQAASG